MQKTVNARTVGAVHTHTHTHTILYRISVQAKERNLENKKVIINMDKARTYEKEIGF